MSDEVKCVSWSVDHDAQVITAKVRVDLIPTRTDPETGKLDVRSAWKRAGQWATAVGTKWSQGKKFKCYSFRLEPDFRAVPSRDLVRDDALDVMLGPRDGPGSKTVAPGPRGRSRSDDASARQIPSRSDWLGDVSNLSSWWNYGEWETISHEVGHLLGLDDGYVHTQEEYSQQIPVPGHVNDVMANPSWPVRPETITRVIRRRPGHPLEDQIRCPLTLDIGPSDINLFLISISKVTLHAWACDFDPPSNDPDRQPRPIEFEGTFHLEGEHLTQIPGAPWQASGKVDFKVEFELPPPDERGISPLSIDAKAWVMRQTVRWGEDGLPFCEGPLFVHVREDGVVSPYGVPSDMFFPGPPLWAKFSHGARPGECE